MPDKTTADQPRGDVHAAADVDVPKPVFAEGAPKAMVEAYDHGPYDADEGPPEGTDAYCPDEGTPAIMPEPGRHANTYRPGWADYPGEDADAPQPGEQKLAAKKAAPDKASK